MRGSLSSCRACSGDLPQEVGVLTGGFAVVVGFGVVAPAIPVFAREFGVGVTAAGAVISAFALMRLVSALASVGGWWIGSASGRSWPPASASWRCRACSPDSRRTTSSYSCSAAWAVSARPCSPSCLHAAPARRWAEQRGRASGLFQSGLPDRRHRRALHRRCADQHLDPRSVLRVRGNAGRRRTDRHRLPLIRPAR